MTNKRRCDAPWCDAPRDPDESPIYKFGGRWICDGPEGRFQAKSKKEIVALLAASGGRYDDAAERPTLDTQPPRLAVDARGYVWRVYADHWSMCPVNPDNSAVPEPVTFYAPVDGNRRATGGLIDADACVMPTSSPSDPPVTRGRSSVGE